MQLGVRHFGQRYPARVDGQLAANSVFCRKSISPYEKVARQVAGHLAANLAWFQKWDRWIT